MKRMKIIMVLLLSLGLFGMQTTSVIAVDSIPTETINKIGTENTTTTETTNPTYTAANGYLEVDENGQVVGNPADAVMQNVTVEEVNDKVTTKMREVISIVQNFGIPACILFFILSVIYTVFGALTKRGAIARGFLAMGICVLCFTAIVYAYDIVGFASSWLVN